MNLLKRALSVDWKGLWLILHQAAKESKRGHIELFRDMVAAYRSDGVNWLNFVTFGFHMNRSAEYRRTFVSQSETDDRLEELHTLKGLQILSDKGNMYRFYKPFLARDFVDLREDSFEQLEALLDKHPVVFVKPPNACGGKGIERFQTADIKDRRLFRDERLTHGQFLVEEAIKQHPEMSKLSPNAINTVRVGTAKHPNGEVTVVYRTLRVACSDAFVDNGSLGGAWALLQPDGTIPTPLYANYPLMKRFSEHPLTHFPFVGFKVPLIREVDELTIAAAKASPEPKYIGWDVAVGVNGPLIVEANANPSAELFQEYQQLPEGRGLRKELEEALDMKFHI